MTGNICTKYFQLIQLAYVYRSDTINDILLTVWTQGNNMFCLKLARKTDKHNHIQCVCCFHRIWNINNLASVNKFWLVWSQSILQRLEFTTKKNFALLWDYCERPGAKRNGYAVESIFTVTWGFPNNAISRKLLIFFIVLMEHKFFIFDHINYIRDESTVPAGFEKKKTEKWSV